MGKLVRDKIPEIIKNNNKIPIFYVADTEEYYKALLNKLDEELREFVESNNIEELADVAEIIDAILEYKNVSKKEFDSIKDKKAFERGKFNNRFILK